MTQYLFEFVGTLILVLFGDGVCAACSLNKSKAQGAGWVVIALGWGLAVMMGVLVAGPVSGAHLNPAVTLGLAIAGTFPWASVLGYIVAQMLGGFVGAVLVWSFYKDHYKATASEPATMLGTFCTMPAIKNLARNFWCEVVATCMLVFIILALGTSGNAFTGYVRKRLQLCRCIGLYRCIGLLAGHLPDYGYRHVPGWNHRICPEPGP